MSQRIATISLSIAAVIAALVAVIAAAGCSSRTFAGDGRDPDTCRDTILGACATSTAAMCVATWADAETDLRTCSTPYVDAVYDCGNYHVRQVYYVDTATLSFYAKETGLLVAIRDQGMGTDGCHGGPASFPMPACQIPSYLDSKRDCPDAGPQPDAI